jgi:hypothetical protein
VARGRFSPNLLQAIAEFDHGPQNLISLEQLRMSNEELRGAMGEHRGTLLLRQFAKHRPYYAATVVTQDVHAIGDQRPHGVGIDARAVPTYVRRRRKAANASESQRTKQADP